MTRLVVEGWGKTIAVENEQIIVKEREKNGTTIVHRRAPSELKQVVITGKGALTTSAIELLALNGVDVIFINWQGKVTARISPPIMRTVNTRREQYRAYDTPKGGKIAKEIVRSKIRNQIALLGTLAKSRKDTTPSVADAVLRKREIIKKWLKRLEAIQEVACDEIRGELLTVEGNSSRFYWEAISSVIPESFSFKSRSGRYATDPINALLNYGYAILEGECWRGIHYAGLDPYGGFLHVDRPGRASMVLDLMEEFRQQVVDKVVLELVNHKRISETQFMIENGVCVMNDSVRKLLLQELLSKLEDYVRYDNQKIRWSDLVGKEAIEIAKFLREETKKIKGFWLRW